MRSNTMRALDYRCIARRVTGMQRIACGLPAPQDEAGVEIIARLERVRRFPRHGDGPRALEIIGDVEKEMLDIAEPDDLLEPEEASPTTPPQAHKRLRRPREFGGTITDDTRMIPNHAERRRDNEVVSTTSRKTPLDVTAVRRAGARLSRRGSAARITSEPLAADRPRTRPRDGPRDGPRRLAGPPRARRRPRGRGRARRAAGRPRSPRAPARGAGRAPPRSRARPRARRPSPARAGPPRGRGPRARPRRRGAARASGPAPAGRRRPGGGRQRQRVLEPPADVEDPRLHGRRGVVRPQAPADARGVVDRAEPHEAAHRALALRPGAEARRRPRARHRVEHREPAGGQPAVAPAPERRGARQRQHQGPVPRHPRHQRHARVGVPGRPDGRARRRRARAAPPRPCARPAPRSARCGCGPAPSGRRTGGRPRRSARARARPRAAPPPQRGRRRSRRASAARARAGADLDPTPKDLVLRMALELRRAGLDQRRGRGRQRARPALHDEALLLDAQGERGAVMRGQARLRNTARTVEPRDARASRPAGIERARSPGNRRAPLIAAAAPS